MALPKRRHSNTRTRKRRTHYKATAPNLSKCKHCGALKLPHRICLKCGYYNGVEIIKKKKEKKKKKKA